MCAEKGAKRIQTQMLNRFLIFTCLFILSYQILEPHRAGDTLEFGACWQQGRRGQRSQREGKCWKLHLLSYTHCPFRYILLLKLRGKEAKKQSKTRDNSWAEFAAV